MERKNGEFACFKKQSQKGTVYFNGSLTLDGKEYWISIFNNRSQKGDQYLSGSIQPKQKQEEPAQKSEYESDIDDKEIPF